MNINPSNLFFDSEYRNTLKQALKNVYKGNVADTMTAKEIEEFKTYIDKICLKNNTTAEELIDNRVEILLQGGSMDFKVNYLKLSDISDKVVNNHEKLINELKDLLKIAEDIKTSWDGPDYESFNDKLTEYITTLIPVTEDIKYIGDYIKKAARTYEGNDNKWNKDIVSLEKEDKRYEE